MNNKLLTDDEIKALWWLPDINGKRCPSFYEHRRTADTASNKAVKATLSEVKGIIRDKNKEFQDNQQEADSNYWMGKLDCTWEILKAIDGLGKK